MTLEQDSQRTQYGAEEPVDDAMMAEQHNMVHEQPNTLEQESDKLTGQRGMVPRLKHHSLPRLGAAVYVFAVGCKVKGSGETLSLCKESALSVLCQRGASEQTLRESCSRLLSPRWRPVQGQCARLNRGARNLSRWTLNRRSARSQRRPTPS